MFPTINNIEDVLPHLEGKKEFKVMYRDECITIDYVYQDKDTFSHPILKECRGIKFDKDTGEIKARPFHKFFNQGENPEEEVGRSSSEATLYEKLDGSLIHFIEHEGEIRACTKAGITDVSIQAENELELTEEFKSVVKGFIGLGVTLCFEYISPNNRIVVRYDKPELVLLGARDNATGKYYDSMEFWSVCLGVRTAKTYADISIENIREWKDNEGVVLEYPDGYRLKVKADHYVLKHRIKDQLYREHNVLRMVLLDETDDLAGILEEEDYKRVVDYKSGVWKGVQNTVKRVECWCDDTSQLPDRKTVSQYVSGSIPKELHSVFWKAYDGKDSTRVVVDFVLKNTNRDSYVDKIRNIIDCYW